MSASDSFETRSYGQLGEDDVPFPFSGDEMVISDSSKLEVGDILLIDVRNPSLIPRAGRSAIVWFQKRWLGKHSARTDDCRFSHVGVYVRASQVAEIIPKYHVRVVSIATFAAYARQIQVLRHSPKLQFNRQHLLDAVQVLRRDKVYTPRLELLIESFKNYKNKGVLPADPNAETLICTRFALKLLTIAAEKLIPFSPTDPSPIAGDNKIYYPCDMLFPPYHERHKLSLHQLPILKLV